MPRLSSPRVALFAALYVVWQPATAAAANRPVPRVVADSVIPNDNRRPEGRLRDGVLHVTLTAQQAKWRPDLAVDTMATVYAFAGGDGVARIPGPLVRTTVGTHVRITLRNALSDSTLIVHGLRGGAPPAEDTIQVAAGATRVVSFHAKQAGTFFYWASRSGSPINRRSGRDSQLTGAIIVDAAGAVRDPHERIFVITLIDIYPDSTRPPPREDLWEVAINGRSWPHTERLHYTVGDTVRWRWINATDRLHPIHLHGFHFRVTAGGTWREDTTYASDAQPEMVTRTAFPGQAFAMKWVPTRPGNWLVHCHMAGHMSPFPERPDSIRAHKGHVSRHPVESMAGLVIGIEVKDRRSLFRRPYAQAPVARRIRIVAGERASLPGKLMIRGLVVQKGTDPARDSVEVPGTPLMLTRGERSAITVVNRMTTSTSIHWHGMELDHGFDGVAGWSGSGKTLAPLIAPGDSFTVVFTPPRSGTFIYHAHMEEEPQLIAGMYGAMLVLDSGATRDPTTDLLFVAGYTVLEGVPSRSLNASAAPTPIEVIAGRTYRLRLINILPNEGVAYTLTSDEGAVPWRLLAKDAADLPASLARPVTTAIRSGVGETYDMEWTPTKSGEVTLTVLVAPALRPTPITQILRVRAP